MKKIKIADTIYFALLCAVIIVFAWNLHFDMSSDENHYLATAYRFWRGDRMLIDDWSPEQLNAALMLPFFYIYMAFVGTTAGIVLYFRRIYLIIQILVFTFCYRHLSFDKWTKRMGLLGYLFFVPYNISTLSYNTVPLSMMLIVITIMLMQDAKKGYYYLLGIALSFAVLGNPFCVLVYIALIAIFVIQKRKISDFLMITLGCATVATLFLIYIFSRGTLSEVMVGLSYIMSEGDHSMTFMQKAVEFITQFIGIYFIDIIATLVAVLMCTLQKKVLWISGKLICVVSCFGFLLNLAYIVIINRSSLILAANQVMYLVMLAGVVYGCYYRWKNTEYNVAFSLGITYVISSYLASNTMVLSTSAAANVAAVFVMLFLICDTNLNEKNYRLYKGLLMISTLAVLLYTRIFSFWYGSLHTIETMEIEKGPLSQINVPSDFWYEIERHYQIVDYAKRRGNNSLFYGLSDGLPYLYAECEVSTSATPFFVIDYDRLAEYYRIHPEKFPEAVFYPSPTEEDLNSWFVKELYSRGYVIEQNVGTFAAFKK